MVKVAEVSRSFTAQHKLHTKLLNQNLLIPLTLLTNILSELTTAAKLPSETFSILPSHESLSSFFFTSVACIRQAFVAVVGSQAVGTYPEVPHHKGWGQLAYLPYLAQLSTSTGVVQA